MMPESPAAELDRLRDENAELRCRVGELLDRVEWG